MERWIDRLVAHRGNAADFKENSVEAILSAIELGLKYVEIDVQMSSDAVPFLIHDGDLRRLHGLDRCTVDTEAAALESLGIASLSQIIGLFPSDMTVFVEIKTDGMKRFGREAVVNRICEKLSDQCVVISFDTEAAQLARKAGFRIGVVARDMSEASRARCRAVSPEYVFCDQRGITREVWDGPIWAAYEIADIEMASKMLGFGVDLLETMHVRKFLL
jgi:glycerophosphoryl diester phosphodiesterase